MFLVVSFLSGLFASFSLFMMLLYQVKIKMSTTKLKIIKKITTNFKIDRKYFNYQKIINSNFCLCIATNIWQNKEKSAILHTEKTE